MSWGRSHVQHRPGLRSCSRDGVSVVKCFWAVPHEAWGLLWEGSEYSEDCVDGPGCGSRVLVSPDADASPLLGEPVPSLDSQQGPLAGW